jgi:hypothetical protein
MVGAQHAEPLRFLYFRAQILTPSGLRTRALTRYEMIIFRANIISDKKVAASNV